MSKQSGRENDSYIKRKLMQWAGPEIGSEMHRICQSLYTELSKEGYHPLTQHVLAINKYRQPLLIKLAVTSSPESRDLCKELLELAFQLNQGLGEGQLEAFTQKAEVHLADFNSPKKSRKCIRAKKVSECLKEYILMHRALSELHQSDVMLVAEKVKTKSEIISELVPVKPLKEIEELKTYALELVDGLFTVACKGVEKTNFKEAFSTYQSYVTDLDPNKNNVQGFFGMSLLSDFLKGSNDNISTNALLIWLLNVMEVCEINVKKSNWTHDTLLDARQHFSRILNDFPNAMYRGYALSACAFLLEKAGSFDLVLEVEKRIMPYLEFVPLMSCKSFSTLVASVIPHYKQNSNGQDIDACIAKNVVELCAQEESMNLSEASLSQLRYSLWGARPPAQEKARGIKMETNIGAAAGGGGE